MFRLENESVSPFFVSGRPIVESLRESPWDVSAWWRAGEGGPSSPSTPRPTLPFPADRLSSNGYNLQDDKRRALSPSTVGARPWFHPT